MDILKKQGNKKTRNDIAFIALLFVVIVVFALALVLFSKSGDTVKVTVDGKLYGEYPLSENMRLEIRNGDGYNILVIQDGKAYVSVASCPDGICSSHSPIFRNGESIICLPNKVVIEAHAKQRDEPDITA